RTNLVFALEVSQWDNEEEEMRAVPSVDAVEYIDFSLNSTVLPDEEAIDINLSDNTGDSELRFSTLSENRATDELTATLDFTLGTDYAKNNFTPVVEGDPVVTYGGAKVRQTYKIILPKTTYPVAGTLTVEDVATTKKQIFNITSIPKYENTDYKPVLVRGKYSGQEEGEDEDRYWAPVNVGATSTTYSVNLAGCGYVFQWGRNVPFVYGSSNDTYDGPVYPETPVEDYANKFIATNQADWLQLEEDEEDDRWQGANAQGPCPDGWRVPTGTELTVLKSNISSAVTNNRVSVTGVGATLFLPAAGSRNNSGGWINQGAYGQYWSSSISGTNATRMYFNGSSSIINTYGRAFGFSVRCIQK
ncbi:MAG: fibrobacter succinogenes major paralogous domain-containing protein, partial [Prevotella sp.]|nr:fibrobacter succinogenes major paralogous domain-containing protein [Prevotella sp.]